MTVIEPEIIWKVRRRMTVAVACLSILALLGIAVTAIYVVEQRGETARLVAYNDCQRKAIQLMASSGVEMLTVILPPPSGQRVPTQEEKITAVQKWRDAQVQATSRLKAADDARAANQLPHCP